MPRLIRIQDVQPHELLKIEAPWMAISIVRDAFFDPFSTLAVQGIDDIINAYNPYTFSDRNERNYNRLTQEMESGDILLVHTFNQPFSPAFKQVDATSGAPSSVSVNANAAATPFGQHQKTEQPQIEIVHNIGTSMFAATRLEFLKDGGHWQATLAAQHANMTNDIDEEPVDEVDEQEEARLANTPVPVVSKSFVAANPPAANAQSTPEATTLALNYYFEDGSPIDENIDYLVVDSAGTKHTGTLTSGKGSLTNLPLGTSQISYIPQQTIDQDEAELAQLRQEFKQSLDGMISELKAESQKEDEAFLAENLVVRFVWRRWERAKGVYQGAESLVVGIYDLAKFAVETNIAVYQAMTGFVAKSVAGDIEGMKQDLETILAATESQYSELKDAFELLQDIITDDELRTALFDFPERWFDAQSILDKERLTGIVAFEIILAILTAGVGAAVSAASKSKHLAKAGTTLKKASKLLKRKRLKANAKIDLTPDANVDNQIGKAKLELEDVAKTPKPDYIELAPGEKGAWNKALNGKLKPNTKYKVGDYYYETDELGRVSKVTGKLDLEKMDRNTYQQGKAGATDGIKDGLEEDEGGHLIASIFKGPGEQINYAAMDGNLNKGAWKRMENKWAEALKGDPPKIVEVEINSIFDGDNKRPEAFDIKYYIDGKKKSVTLLNKPGG